MIYYINMTMMMKIILLSFLSAINIEDASSYTLNNKYTNSGFYQGHHKIEPNPQEPAVIPMPVHNIKYTNSGFYQGDSKIKSKIEPKPKPNPQQPTLLPTFFCSSNLFTGMNLLDTLVFGLPSAGTHRLGWVPREAALGRPYYLTKCR